MVLLRRDDQGKAKELLGQKDQNKCRGSWRTSTIGSLIVRQGLCPLLPKISIWGCVLTRMFPLLAKVRSLHEPTLPCTSATWSLALSSRLDGIAHLCAEGNIRKTAVQFLSHQQWIWGLGQQGVEERRMGTWEPAGQLEGELQRLSNSTIRESLKCPTDSSTSRLRFFLFPTEENLWLL